MDNRFGIRGFLALAIGATVAGVLALAIAPLLTGQLARAAPIHPVVMQTIRYQVQDEEPATVLPTVTAQFVATGIERNSWRDEPPVTVEIAQSSSWRKETRTLEIGTNIAYYDRASGASISWFRTHDNSRERLSIQIARGSEYSSVSYAATDRTDRLFGEQCRIWEGTSRFRGAPRQRPSETCVTDDGIVFWQRFHHTDATTRETFRLTSLNRRNVDAAEIMPPQRIFSWSTWRDAVGGEIGGPGLEIELASPPPEEGRPPQADSETVRVTGVWTYTHTVDQGDWQSWRIEAPTLRLAYTESERDVGARQLQISREPAGTFDARRFASPVEPAREETILGRRCTWFNTARVSHASLTACRSNDDLVLARLDVCDGVRGGNCYFSARATRISRDPIGEAQMTPPPRAFIWPGVTH